MILLLTLFTTSELQANVMLVYAKETLHLDEALLHVVFLAEQQSFFPTTWLNTVPSGGTGKGHVHTAS